MCTGIRFSDNNGNMYFGRNLDWSVGYGQKVVITPRNYRLNSAFQGELPFYETSPPSLNGSFIKAGGASVKTGAFF